MGRYEEAIASYDRAVAIKSDLHEAWHDRGISLGILGRHEEAISSYDRAVAFKSDFHESYYDRGVALDNSGRYEEAVASYDRAVAIKPDEHKAWHNRGISLYNLGRCEEAITSFDRAVAIKPDEYKAWHNRGISLGILGRHEEAITSFDRAVAIKPDEHKSWHGRGDAIYAVRVYEPAINNYETALSHFQTTVHAEGWGYLHRAFGRVHYNHGQNNNDKFPLDPRVYYQRALAAYQTAATTLSNFPELHLELIQDFLRVYFALQQPEQAETYRQQGRELLQQLLNNQQTPQQRRQLLTKFNSFRQQEVDVLLQNNQPSAALAAAELTKNLCLESLFDALQETIVSPSYDQIQTLLPADTAIIYWHLSPTALSTFILQPGDSAPQAFHTSNLKPLTDWIAHWDNTNIIEATPTHSKTKKDHPDLAPAFAQLDWPALQDILQIDQIKQHLHHPSHLILIPHKDLHRLPLHQFFDLPTTYLPSLQIALNLAQKPPATSPLYLHLCDPPQGSELAAAEVEVAVISALYPPAETLPNTKTTPTGFRNFIATAAPGSIAAPIENRILHFTGHAQHFARRPQDSCLYLNNNETFTCKDLSNTNLQAYRLIILSACQTSIVQRQSLNDEYVGLVSACLCGGANYTISALWSIKASTSATLFIYFYQQLAQNMPIPEAFHKSSQWLRNVTNQELQRFYADLLPKLTDRQYINIRQYINFEITLLKEYPPNDRPFQAPYHWAGFTLSGFGSALK